MTEEKKDVTIDFKNVFRELGIFLRYLIVKPFMELGDMFKMMYEGVGTLDKPYFWVKFFGMATIFFVVMAFTTKNWKPAYIVAGAMFVALLRFEWISGRFRKWHTEQLKKRAKIANEEGMKNGSQ